MPFLSLTQVIARDVSKITFAMSFPQSPQCGNAAQYIQQIIAQSNVTLCVDWDGGIGLDISLSTLFML